VRVHEGRPRLVKSMDVLQHDRPHSLNLPFRTDHPRLDLS